LLILIERNRSIISMVLYDENACDVTKCLMRLEHEKHLEEFYQYLNS